MPVYLPWWVGGAVLAVVTVGCCVVARRPLGVSGIVGRMVNLRGELAAERARALAAANEAAMDAALLAATAEAFGPAPAVSASDAGPVATGGGALAIVETGRESCGGECASPASRPTVGAHAAFLGAIVVGGLAARLARGGWALELDLGPTFERVVGAGVRGAVALAIGGLLVGVGTTVGGGCSTGHGLSGCSRLQPAGVVATASFVLSAVAVSFLLAGRGSP